MNTYKKRGINLQTCKRCGTAFSPKLNVCPNCHFNRKDFIQRLPPQKQCHQNKENVRHSSTQKHESTGTSGRGTTDEVIMINKYIRVSKSGKYHVCTRCNLAFIKEIDCCPRCDVTDEDNYYSEIDANNYYAEGSGRDCHGAACDICPHCHGTADWCPLLD
ncbi:MAG: hypothetical protein IJ685_04810 [Selenomonadaceae bacterium]|nr:hypothetical protein [Selenomonadaceae bacterium]